MSQELSSTRAGNGPDAGARRISHPVPMIPSPWTTPEVRTQLVRLANRLLWNQTDAEDAVHDALSTAISTRSALRDETKWLSWLKSIVVQRCRLHHRRARWRKSHESKVASRVSSSDADDNAERIVRGELVEPVRKALERLPRRQREVVTLRFLEGMGYDEIAAILDMKPATCRVHAFAGLESMRQWLARGDETGAPS